MIPRKSPFQFAFRNFFVHKKIKFSENNEDIEDYGAQDHEMLNTMEATTYFWSDEDSLTLKVFKMYFVFVLQCNVLFYHSANDKVHFKDL